MMNRPKYHIVPARGWMNDPNGLVFFKGEYHVFFQASPNHLTNHKICWGHCKSKDLLHWEYCPVALKPDQEYDKDGCFTGSAIVQGERLYLIYTGHKNMENGYMETQNLAWSDDGIHFQKYSGNPVIANPPKDTTIRFRDPKVWKKDERYYVVIGAETQSKTGKAVLYVSDDLVTYRYCGVLAESDGKLGNMWECPNLTSIGGKEILIFSPKGLRAEDGFPCEYESGYFIGKMDYVEYKYCYGRYKKLDYGFDFYAPQVMECGKRKILFAWFAVPNSSGKEMKDGWRHLLTLPRELSISESGTLCMNPIKELEKIRSEEVICEQYAGRWNWKTEQKCLECLFTFQYGKEKRKLIFSDQTGEILIFAFEETEWIFQQKREDTWEIRKTEKKKDGLEVKTLRIYLDENTLEAFFNDGEIVFSTRIYPKGEIKIRIEEDKREQTGKVQIYSLNL